MPEGYLPILSSMGAENIVNDLVSNRVVGIGVWNLTSEKFTVVENITGYEQNAYSTLIEFIEEIANPLDVQMVLKELEKYLQQSKKDYQSTFRLRTSRNSPRWVFLKGNKTISDSTGDELFYVVIMNISDGNFVTGNDKRTNLLEANFFVEKVTDALAIKQPGEKSALIRMVINNYQQIKEKYELTIVLQLIEKVAARLNAVFTEKSELTRFSNDIFLGMLSNYKTKDDIQQFTDEIIEAFKAPFILENNVIQVRISLGITSSPDQANTVGELLLQTEFATKQSKKKGDYVTTFFDSNLAVKFYRQIIIENDLPQAIRENALYPVFQPQMNVKTNNIIGIEVLTRWNHEQLGFISPEVFIKMAEKQGLMPALSRSILEKSLQTANRWFEKGYDFGSLSINVSPMELMKENFIPDLVRLCKKHHFPHSRLEIEITEGVYLDSIGRSDKIINRLDSHGFKMAVDDFGTGYSNLSLISNTKLDTLKIDKTLIDQLGNKEGFIVVEAVVNVAQRLNYHVIAEGVETKEQVQLLNKINCHNIQGYYYSQPLPAGEMEVLLEKNVHE